MWLGHTVKSALLLQRVSAYFIPADTILLRDLRLGTWQILCREPLTLARQENVQRRSRDVALIYGTQSQPVVV